jgi:phenol 2-monooxygenase
MELLEQLDLTGEMTQAGFIGRSYAAYKDGKRVVRKAWQSMFPYMDQSFHNYILNIRQKQSEHIFASRYQNLYDKRVQYGWNIVGYKVDTSPEDDYNVTVSMFHASLGSRAVRW